jgi:hypothetical protein
LNTVAQSVKGLLEKLPYLSFHFFATKSDEMTSREGLASFDFSFELGMSDMGPA